MLKTDPYFPRTKQRQPRPILVRWIAPQNLISRRPSRRRRPRRRRACAITGGDRGSLDVGKRGDLTVLSVDHPNELCLAVGQDVVSDVIIGGEVVHSTRIGGR